MAPSVAGVLLAGGLSRRMGGGDKCLRLLGGQTILSHVAASAQPQVAALALNANGDPDRFRDYDLPVIPDVVEGNVGPLAGILTGMEWAASAHPNCEWLASFPTDAPFTPGDLVARLFAAFSDNSADLACVASGGRDHPVIGLWPVSLRYDLRKALCDEGIRKVDLWTGRYRLARVPYTADPFDPFFNTNRPDDLIAAETILAGATKETDGASG
jgi:molybdopterin-guanine dinucleotide biosynthesis protein A